MFVTNDSDFMNVLAYPPAGTPGVAVLNPPGKASGGILLMLVGSLLDALDRQPIEGRLWIVEPGRIRVHEAQDSQRT